MKGPCSARAGSLALALAAAVSACAGDEAAPEAAAPGSAATAPSRGVDAIDDARLVNAAAEPASWLSYGGTYAEQRFSRLDQIHAGNVAGLGLAFAYETHTTRGRAFNLGFAATVADLDFSLTFVDRIRPVTRDDAQRVARRIFDPQRYAVAVIRPAGR